MFGVIKEELLEITRHATPTSAAPRSSPGEGEIDLEQLIREEDMVISITPLRLRQAARALGLPPAEARRRRRDGMDRRRTTTGSSTCFVASTHDYVLFFTTRRQGLPPQGARAARGAAPGPRTRARQPAAAARGREGRTVIATRDFSEGEYLMQATRNGVVKKTRFREYDTPLQGRRHHRDQHPRGRRAGRARG